MEAGKVCVVVAPNDPNIDGARFEMIAEEPAPAKGEPDRKMWRSRDLQTGEDHWWSASHFGATLRPE